ncbi:Uu.00g014160.m01.CDS01, partial [Anthostomella pinea]
MATDQLHCHRKRDSWAMNISRERSYPTPVSNLGAAHFETGDYQSCIQASLKALELIREEPDDDQKRQKAFRRLTRAYSHLKDAGSARQWAARISLQHDGEAELSSLKLSQRHYTRAGHGDGKGDAKSHILALPRFMPPMQPKAEYFAVGHDGVREEFEYAFGPKPDEKVSLMYCGVGDARNLFQRILVCTAVIARDMIIFHLLDLYAKTRKKDIAIATAHIYSAQIFPVHIWKLVNLRAKRVRYGRHDGRRQVLDRDQQGTGGSLIRPRHTGCDEYGGGRKAQVGAESREGHPRHGQCPVRGRRRLGEEEDGSHGETHHACSEDPMTGKDVERLGDYPGRQHANDGVGIAIRRLIKNMDQQTIFIRKLYCKTAEYSLYPPNPRKYATNNGTKPGVFQSPFGIKG